MKLQYLIIIFLLIMAPIYIVFSKYIDVQIGNINIQNTYDSRLMSATQDAVSAFQSNTLNSSMYVPESRVKYSNASVNAFFTSLNLAFGFNGQTNSVMKEYVPAVVLTMYDGYYIYAPFVNKLTQVSESNVDDEYADNETRSELKPYVTYSCNYKKDQKDYIITYSLDNYIIVDEFDRNSGTNGKHTRHEGYLIGLKQYSSVTGTLDYEHPEEIKSFKFNNIEFSKNTNETLREYLVDEQGKGAFYYYTIRNGTKYYYGRVDSDGNITAFEDNSYLPNKIGDNNTTDVIFYIDDNGNRIKQCENYKDNKERFNNYYYDIKNNTLAFKYYRDAYVFSKWVKENLSGLNAGGSTDHTSIKNSVNYENYSFTEIDDIFGEIDSSTQYIEDFDSKFNQHRRDVIRAVIQTNLSAAIAGFSTYSNSTESNDFIMPKISEDDWDLLENKSCIVTFLQGFPIGGKIYNNYAVVPNTKTREFVDEDDIYVLKDDNTYAKINEKNYNLKSKDSIGFYPSAWKINFELKKIGDKTYTSMCYEQEKIGIPYLESYSSIIGKDLYTTNYSDMYKFIRSGKTDSGNITISDSIKQAYYVALGRERKGMFRFTNYDNQEYENNNPEPQIKVAKLLDGKTINAKMKQLAGNINAKYSSGNTSITTIERSYTIKSSYINNNKYLVSTSDSDIQVYMWYQNNTIYYYSKANTIYANEDSSYMFYNLLKLERINIAQFDTSNVTDMSYMFSYCQKLRYLYSNNFNTSKVKNMSNMFGGCSSLLDLDLSSFDTSNVEDMYKMFYKCIKLNFILVKENKWNTSMVQNSGGMFFGTINLTGGKGTIYDNNHIDKEYARIDKGYYNPGYLTEY